MKIEILTDLVIILFVMDIAITISFWKEKKRLNDANLDTLRTNKFSMEILSERIKNLKTNIQDAFCKECYSKYKPKNSSEWDCCKYRDTDSANFCTPKDKQYFIDKLRIKEIDEREKILGEGSKNDDK